MIGIFDKEIKALSHVFEGAKVTKYGYDESKVLPTSEHSELVLLKDCAFELGGSDKPCACATVVTDDIPLVNQTVVVGKELKDIKNDCSYAKIVILGLNYTPEEEQGIFDLTKSLEYAKYKENVQGFMMRASAISHREQVRVSKSAIKNGLTFEKLGDTTIANYLSKDVVKNVTVIFVADEDELFEDITAFASRTSDILDAFNHILDNVLVDCAHCNLKQICDEVEGMREMHVKMAK